jgi:tRNA(fMet)-specific endonuclease VapC
VSRYLLDTNVLSGLMRKDPLLTSRLRAAIRAGVEVLLSCVVEYELQRGLIRKRSVGLMQKFDAITADLACAGLDRGAWLRAAELWAFSRDAGAPIEDADLLVAAHASELPAVLVTLNTRHFALFRPLGLQLEDWTTP